MYKKYIKRILDFTLSLIAIIILSPVMLVVAILVRIKLGCPVIFKQQRPGINEKIFIMYKFRTMIDKRDKYGELLPDSERLTKFGKFLRSTSLDELPELWNILKGDMSIVGPRPLLVRYLPYFSDIERKRSHVRPGMTGLAQINGRNAISWKDRFSYDIKYVENISFIVDLKIIIDTIFVVIKKKNILVANENVISDLDIERSEDISSE